MTDDRKRKTGGEDARLRAIAYLDSAVAVTVRTDDLKAVLSALAESRAEVAEVREAWDCSRDATLKYRARAERLHAAGMRVTAAFRALGDASNFTAEAHAKHECEEAMIALDAALNLEPTP